MPHFNHLTRQQLEIADRPISGRCFIEGPAGCGKTTAAVFRMLRLVDQGVPADSIFVLTPQRTLAEPYYKTLRSPDFQPGSLPEVLTMGGLARRALNLFWPLIAESAGFGHPFDPPIFLTLETAQYTMARLVTPLLEQGFFDSITINRNRLYSQIIDNLNKAAVVGFPHREIGQRLTEAWSGESSQANIYADAQECANRFREYCMQNNQLDYSLQIEVFRSCLWPMPDFRVYLNRRFRHLIFDNLEEDTPIAHDIICEWLPQLDSALFIYDSQAGYRRFLGADPDYALMLKNQCPDRVNFSSTFVANPGLELFSHEVGQALGRRVDAPPENPGQLTPAIQVKSTRFHPEMIAWTVETIKRLVSREGVSPAEIVVLSPFLSGALRFSMMRALEQEKIPVRSHRPSRSLSEEPATHCLLTLACLAHPGWRITPAVQDVSTALMQAIDGLDPVRAHLLVKAGYSAGQLFPVLRPFEEIHGETKQRITFTLGERYECLRKWLLDSSQDPLLEFDHFLSRLFGEILSTNGFGFHRRIDAGEVAASLIESVRKFRWEVGKEVEQDGSLLPVEYIRLLRDGLVAAQYLPKWRGQAADAVLLSPAHTFLMSNRPVRYQFWLDIGGAGWWERLFQPLTQPYVLSRSWMRGVRWTDTHEFETNQENLYRLCLGLLRRCRDGVYLVVSELGEQGFEQKGPLLGVIDRIRRSYPPSQEVTNA